MKENISFKCVLVKSTPLSEFVVGLFYFCTYKYLYLQYSMCIQDMQEVFPVDFFKNKI